MPLDQPHHDPSARYVDQPRPSIGDTVDITLELPATGQDGEAPEVKGAWLRGMRDAEQFWAEGTQGTGADRDRVRFQLDCTQNVHNYRFHLDLGDGPRWMSGAGLLDWDPPDRDDYRLLTTGGAPEWVPDLVWYQIFPDRFATTGAYAHNDHDTNTSWANWVEWDTPIADGHDAMTQMYGGDLDGITQHLDHLIDLGIGGVYLTPVFPGGSNHRYDASTFSHVDPVLGGNDALVRLSNAAERAGLRVMTDLTLNHTGDRHEWFQTAKANASSDEAGFYFFIDHPDTYQSWLGIDSLPKLDHRSDEMRRRYYEGAESHLAQYLAEPFNMAGWRIDVANMTGRLGPLDLNQQVAKTTRKTMDDHNPDKWLVGEHFFDASLDAPGDGWHGVMNYAGITRPVASWLGQFTALGAFHKGPGQASRNGTQMARAMDAVRAAMPWQVTMGSMSLLSSHDTARWRTMCADDDVAKAGFGFLLCLPGAPTFFYGDEIGLMADSAEKARSTMPWDKGQWDQSFLDWYRTMIATRNNNEALRHGGFRWVHTGVDAVVFLRETASQRLLIRVARAATAPLDVSARLLKANELTGVLNADALTPANETLTLPGDGPALQIWQLSD